MEETMDQPEKKESALFAGRYEILSRDGHAVEVLDHQPWHRCWACGATTNEAGEAFCTECGAALDGRRYLGELAKDASHGLAAVQTISDETARDVLPAIWDQVTEAGKTLTLLVPSNRASLTRPLKELDALRIGLGLARLQQALHSHGFKLGVINANDLELTPTGDPRLRNAPKLRPISEQDADVSADLRNLAGLLEDLTATPRTTQRLDEQEAKEASLPILLRDLRSNEIADAAALATRLEDLIAEQANPQPLWVRVGAGTHEGMVRELDEDGLLALDLRSVLQNTNGRSWGVYIVADGMGGHAAGEVASGLAIRGAAEVVLRSYLTPTLESDAEDETERMADVVRSAILQGNAYVLREAQARGNDMGTTITMALVAGDRAVIGNVGDSRTYLYRDKTLKRISKDHSLVMRLVEMGQITDEEVYSHPQRNAVLRSLGDRAEIEVDIFHQRLKPGDALFLCSDGQWEMVRDPQMAEIIAAHDDPQAACNALIVAANKAGGDDNITAVIVQFDTYAK
jgi:protein phosphatase